MGAIDGVAQLREQQSFRKRSVFRPRADGCGNCGGDVGAVETIIEDIESKIED